jgi:hypothetical protein
MNLSGIGNMIGEITTGVIPSKFCSYVPDLFVPYLFLVFHKLLITR